MVKLKSTVQKPPESEYVKRSPDEPAPIKRAVLFIHGIGLQRRFEELTNFVNGLLDADALKRFRNNGKKLSDELKEMYESKGEAGKEMFQEKSVTLGKGLELGIEMFNEYEHYDTRLAFKVPPEKTGDAPVEVDVYEMYWAPFMAAQINLYGVLLWMMSTVPKLFRSASPLRLPPSERMGKIILETGRFLLVIGVTFLVLGVVYELGLWMIASGRLLLENFPTSQFIWTWRFLFLVPGLLLACFIAYGVVGMNIMIDLERAVIITGTILIYAMIVIAAGFKWIIPLIILFTVALMVILLLQKYIVGYLGDVAVYVNYSEVRKEFSIRTAIIEKMIDHLNFLLGINLKTRKFNREPGSMKKDEGNIKPERDYDDIVIVAHSLGSVIAYDALNRVLYPNGSEETDAARQKIRHLFTVGSPLEKIWYYFRDHSHRDDPVYQGIIGELKGLKKKGPDEKSQLDNCAWTNIWAFTDVISSRLDRYGDGVENKHDHETNHKLWILNHLKYWYSSMAMKHIGNRIFSEEKHG